MLRKVGTCYGPSWAVPKPIFTSKCSVLLFLVLFELYIFASFWNDPDLVFSTVRLCANEKNPKFPEKMQFYFLNINDFEKFCQKYQEQIKNREPKCLIVSFPGRRGGGPGRRRLRGAELREEVVGPAGRGRGLGPARRRRRTVERLAADLLVFRAFFPHAREGNSEKTKFAWPKKMNNRKMQKSVFSHASHCNADGWLRSSVFIASFPTLPVS